MTIRILIVDDQPAVRRGLRMRLAVEPDLDVVGEADNGEEAIVLAKWLRPDVVLMDIEMPRLDGIAATRRLCAAHPQCSVVVLSLHDSATNQERARAAGAVAFVPKQSGTDSLIAAIRQSTPHGA